MNTFATDLAAEQVPNLRTPQLAHAIEFWQDVAGFQLKRHIPGVVAILAQGATQLQLWRVARGSIFKAGSHRVAVQDAFATHRAMARLGRSSLSGEPQMQCWGAWEFSVTDLDGNRLHLAQWAANRVLEADQLVLVSTGTPIGPCLAMVKTKSQSQTPVQTPSPSPPSPPSPLSSLSSQSQPQRKRPI